MQEPDKIIRIKYLGVIPSWIDSVFQDIPNRRLSGNFYEAIGFDEAGKSFRVDTKDIQVQFYDATRNNWASFSHVEIYFFHLSDSTGYQQIWEIFDFSGNPPKEKDFTQTVIGFIDDPLGAGSAKRKRLTTTTYVDYHELPLDDIQGLESVLRSIIHRSLDLGHLMKVCALGDGKKTEIIRRYVDGKFETNYLPTLGVDITTKRTNFYGLQVKLILMDTASQESFGKLRPSYYRGASGGILFFDLAQDQATVSTLANWIGEFQKTTGDVPIALVGLLPDEESSEECSIQNFAQENDMQLFLMNIRDPKTLSLICEELIKLRFTKRKN